MTPVGSRRERAGEWWRTRQPRERAMLAVMVAMVAAFVLWYGVLSPLWRARDAAQARREQAAAALDGVRRDAAALAALDAAMPLPPADPAALRSAVLDCAARAGLAVAREHTGSDGVLAIGVDAATPAQLLGFLDDLRVRHGLAPATLSAAAGAGGLRVEAGFAASTLPGITS